MSPTVPTPALSRRVARRSLTSAALVAALTALAGCAAPNPNQVGTTYSSWDEVIHDAEGQTVNLWMYGGDEQGNAYVDNVLAPAVAKAGVTLERVPVADTKDALNRVLTELQAGRTSDGTVDLVWVNGDNFRTGKEAGAWLCAWTPILPNMANTSATDPLLANDFGTPVDGCEAPWHKAQFTFAYNSDVVDDPPTSIAGILAWAEAHPGRFTYPAPPDFTGSAFIREVLYSESGGYSNVPPVFSADAYDRLTPKLFETLSAIGPKLWRGGDTYPASSGQLNTLYADGQIDMTMTYGPATLTELVTEGTYPAGTKVLPLAEGTMGNASFLAIPSNAADSAGAMVVANIALSVEQQVAKAEPATWGQFTVLDLDSLSGPERARFDALPQSPVVPAFDVLSRNANPELAAAWVPALDEGWRTHVLAGR
ncbi:putative spermidine/putrescine transport system substrate-binding protein [Mycetocola sp. CAN_C7]|uniref:ABC transporter substrate-binding protein n=1 Tax=Mycetocola sp. CAN_C7 TaxID=2787724 RepID=UPI0018CBB623